MFYVIDTTHIYSDYYKIRDLKHIYPVAIMESNNHPVIDPEINPIIAQFENGEFLFGQSALITGRLREIGVRAEMIRCKGKMTDRRSNYARLKLSFSISRVLSILHGKSGNTEIVSPESMNEVLDALEIALFDSGIYLQEPFNDCKLSRIDLTRDRLMNHLIKFYAPAFQASGFSHGTVKGIGKSFYIGNKQQMTCIYDKGTLNTKQGILIPKFPEDQSFMRIEYRMENLRKIRSVLGIENVGQLRKSYYKFVKAFKDNLNNIFRYFNPASLIDKPVKSRMSSSERDIELMKIIKKSDHPNSAFTLATMAVRLSQINQLPGGIDTHIKNCVNAGIFTDSNGSKQKSKFLNILQNFATPDATHRPELIAEILDKFLNDAPAEYRVFSHEDIVK